MQFGIKQFNWKSIRRSCKAVWILEYFDNILSWSSQHQNFQQGVSVVSAFGNISIISWVQSILDTINCHMQQKLNISFKASWQAVFVDIHTWKFKFWPTQSSHFADKHTVPFRTASLARLFVCRGLNCAALPIVGRCDFHTISHFVVA